MRKWLVLLTGALLALGLTGAGQAQSLRPGIVAVASDGITAHGHAEIKAKPDVAMLTMGVMTQGQNPTETAQDNATRSTALLAALRKAGLATQDIQTQSYTVQPLYDYSGKSPTLTGYQVNNTIQVKIHNLPQVGTVIDAATQAGATNINGPSYDLTDRGAVESQALAQAVTSAHQKAAAMAGAADVVLGPLLTLTDGQAATVEPVYPMMMGRSMAAGAQATTPISPQQISITADVTAVYQVGAATR